MPDVPVTLVPWFDAKDNPPKPDAGKQYPTDSEIMVYADDVAEGETTWAVWDYDNLEEPRVPPRVWCDPSPPDMSDPLGPLTVEDLRGLDDAFNALIADDDDHIAAYGPMLARLRRALDQIGTQ